MIRDLTICTRCSRDFVQPVDWFEADDGHWHIRLRCGNCGHIQSGMFDQRTADLFDTKLDAAADVLARSLKRMELQNLEREADRFAAALAADAIWPEDFHV